jgi:DNA-binding MarR family transcriptional regulator
MTLPQWGVLYAVTSIPDASTHALALFTGQSDQAAGAVVARLERRGLIERRPGVGKAILHRITSEGEGLVRQCSTIIEEAMQRLLSGLADRDRQILRSCLQVIADAGETGSP